MILSTIYNLILIIVFNNYLSSFINILYIYIFIKITLKKYNSRNIYLFKT
jgi:hypothetical protein